MNSQQLYEPTKILSSLLLTSNIEFNRFLYYTKKGINEITFNYDCMYYKPRWCGEPKKIAIFKYNIMSSEQYKKCLFDFCESDNENGNNVLDNRKTNDYYLYHCFIEQCVYPSPKYLREQAVEYLNSNEIEYDDIRIEINRNLFDDKYIKVYMSDLYKGLLYKSYNFNKN